MPIEHNYLRTRVRVANIVKNYELLRQNGGQVVAVVKADAYGLGADRVAPALQAAGCLDFFVAHLSEALALKAPLARNARIYVLNGLQPGAEAACAEAGVIPVINSLEQARLWRALAERLGRPLPIALQVDSGMSRLGLSPADIDRLVADPSFFERAPLALLMSHLACADEPDSPANPQQLAAFEAAAAKLPAARRSLANSGGVFLQAGFHGDLARPGVALYGAAPNTDRPNPMAPVVGLTARVIQVRDVAAGQAVGYGLTYARETPGRIATIAVGYADGWPRSLSNRGAAFHRGVRLPIAGRVSMDSLGLDVTALADHGLSLRLGDEVELIGPHQTLEDVAQQAGTIPYEILTSLGRRYHRTYLETAPAVVEARPLEAAAS